MNLRMNVSFGNDMELRDYFFLFLKLAGVALALMILLFWAGSSLYNSFLGGLFVIAVVMLFGYTELLLSIFIVITLKLGGHTTAALIKPWGGGEALDATMKVVTDTSYPQLALGIFTILFVVLQLLKQIVARIKS